MEDLNGKTALITGGSKGIGLGIAEALVRQGMNVLVTSRHDDEAKDAAQRLSRTGPGRAIGVAADVRDLGAQQKAVDRVLEEWGRLDVLIANAGVGRFAPVAELRAEDWQATIDTNLTGVFYSVKAAVPALRQSKGYLITIASLAGTNFFAGGAAYNASKFGLVGFTQAVMLDLRHDGVKVTTIMPGSVASYFNDRRPGDNDAWKIQPEDLGQMVVDLLRLPERTLPSKIEVRPTQPPR
jgi:NAD(P)-dependent dehydrogenase (short-subunit alcohol dehydrogenase family)